MKVSFVVFLDGYARTVDYWFLNLRYEDGSGTFFVYKIIVVYPFSPSRDHPYILLDPYISGKYKAWNASSAFACYFTVKKITQVFSSAGLPSSVPQLKRNLLPFNYHRPQHNNKLFQTRCTILSVSCSLTESVLCVCTPSKAVVTVEQCRFKIHN